MREIKAIQTVYKGFKFRSRLEARWAIFFDEIGIKWEYEKEGYDLDGLWYLPDFFLPELGLGHGYWVEVKGQTPDTDSEGEWIGEDIEKAKRLLAKSDSLAVFLLCGAMDISQPPTIIGFSYDENGEIESAEHYSFARCPVCGRVGIAWAGYVMELGCGCYSELNKVLEGLNQKIRDRVVPSDPDYDDWHIRAFRMLRGDSSQVIEQAFLKAQQARFEHGEQP